MGMLSVLSNGLSMAIATSRGEMKGGIVSSTLENRGVETTVPVREVVERRWGFVVRGWA